MKQFLIVSSCLMTMVLGLSASFAFANDNHGKPESVTICHAAGQDGTTKFVTLTLPYNAVYGNGGHFNENGTTQAGHEDDYLGPCNGEPNPCETSAAAQYGECEPTETTPTETTPTETTPTTPTTSTPPAPRCTQAGYGPYRGKDGAAGNDECCPDFNNNQICDDEEKPPTTTATQGGATPTATTTPTATSGTSTATVSNPPAVKTSEPKTTTPKTSSSTSAGGKQLAPKNGKSKPTKPKQSATTLPYTGAMHWPVALAGLIALLVGVVLRFIRIGTPRYFD